MKKFIPSFIFWFICLGGMQAQEGFHYLTHYQHTFNNLDYQNNDILQSQSGIMYFANRRGVIAYDGFGWIHIQTDGSVYVLEEEQGGEQRIFVGGKNGFGYLAFNEYGETSYVSLSKDAYRNYDFVKLEIIEGRLYAYAEELLVEYDLEKEGLIQNWFSDDARDVIGFFRHQDTPFLITTDSSAIKISGENKSRVPFLLPYDDEVLYYTPLGDSSKTLIGTLEGRIYTFDGASLAPIELDDQNYFDRSDPNSAIDLGNGIVAFSTLRGGCLIVDLNTKEISEILNTQSRLATNEIYAIGVDRTAGLWMTHAYGYSRADMQLPFRNFSSYNGLEGRIKSIQQFDGRNFVSTTAGLYVLSKVKNYKEVGYIVQQKADPTKLNRKRGNKATDKKSGSGLALTIENELTEKPEIVIDPSLTRQLEEAEEDKEDLSRKERRQQRRKERRRRRLVRRLERDQEKEAEKEAEKKEEREKKESKTEAPKKEGQEENIEKLNEEVSLPDKSKKEAQKEEPTAQSERQYIKDGLRVKRELEIQSVKYLFKKVEGLPEGEVLQLLVKGENFFALHQEGLYRLVSPSKVVQVSDLSADRLYLSPHDGTLYYHSKERVGKLSKRYVNNWQTTVLFKDFGDKITRLTSDPKGRLWAIGYDYIHLLSHEKGENSSQGYSIENDFDDEAIPIILGDTLFFLLSENTYFFDDEDQRFVTDTTTTALRVRSSNTVISPSEEQLWLKSDGRWTVIGGDNLVRDRINLLNLLGELNTIVPDQNPEFIWVITKNNQLYRFHINGDESLSYRYPILLSSIRRLTDNESLKLGDVLLDYEKNSLSFGVRSPDYLSGKALEYQFALFKKGGRSSEWSEWKKTPNFDFSALDQGTYILKIRSRNIFGEETEGQEIKIRIRPPYWQTSWFYALEILVFVFLIGITAFFNRRQTKEKVWMIILRQTLTILTLIMCMEFLKVVLESFINISGSPVIDFGMEVVFALLIFPVERLFRNYVFRNPERMH